MAFGDDGIIKRAEQAKDIYANDTAYTDQSMANATAYLDEMLNGVTGGGTEEPEQSEVQKAKEEGTVFDDKTVITDGEGNKITIPKGFKIAAESGDTVQ